VVATAQPSTPLFTRQFFSVVAVQVLFNYGLSTFLLLPKYLSLQLGATAEQLGRANAIQGCIAVLAVPFVGSLVDRVGRRPLMATGAALLFVYALAWLGVSHIGPLMYSLQLLSGLAFMFAFSGSSTLIADLAPPERMSQAIGVFGAANISMNALAPAIAEPTAARFGWHATFVLAAVFALLSLILSRFIREPARPNRPSYAPAQPTGHFAASLEVARPLATNLAAMASCGAAFGAVFTFYQPFVLSQGAQHVSLFFTLAAVCTRVGLGSLADRIGRRRVAIRAYVMYALVVLAMTQLAPSRLLAFGFAFGFAHGFFYPALNGLALERITGSQRGRAMTLVNGSFHLGNTVSVVLFGWVAHRYGYPAVFVLASLAACLGIFTLVADAPRASLPTAAVVPPPAE
jgi:MFS family permease